MKRLDLTGKRFGKLIALQDVGADKHSRRLWLCICDCGSHVVKMAGVFAKPGQKSFGCTECMRLARIHVKHGESRTPLYTAWINMRGRCSRPTEKNKYWNGKGITVCDEWQRYEAFCEWSLSNGYEKGLSIDRINSDGPYSPDNCRWVTVSQNTVFSLDRRYGR